MCEPPLPTLLSRERGWQTPHTPYFIVTQQPGALGCGSEKFKSELETPNSARCTLWTSLPSLCPMLCAKTPVLSVGEKAPSLEPSAA